MWSSFYDFFKKRRIIKLFVTRVELMFWLKKGFVDDIYREKETFRPMEKLFCLVALLHKTLKAHVQKIPTRLFAPSLFQPHEVLALQESKITRPSYH